MKRILITNDDGVQSPGLLALKQALAPLADITIFAPDRNWSAAGHTKTMHKPCLLYTSDAADERSSVDLGGRRIIKKKTDFVTGCRIRMPTISQR